MTVFLHTTLEVKASRKRDFIEIMRRVVEIMKEAGWELVGAYEHSTGRFHTFIDLWKLRDHNHFQEGLDYCVAQPDIDHVVEVLAETVLTETVVFLRPAEFAA
jgi:hypothetical protein